MIVSTLTGTDPIDLATAKKHLNVSFNDDDAYITTLIDVSLSAVESYCRTHFRTRDNSENIGKFSTGVIPSRLLTSITHAPSDEKITIEYTTGGTPTVLDVVKQSIYSTASNNYVYINKRIAVGLLDTLTVDILVDVVLKWKTGLTTMDKAITHARLLLIGTYYENRESATGINLNDLPNGIEMLLDGYVNPQVG